MSNAPELPKLLIVDDTPAALKLLGMMVDSMGYEFDSAEDGEQALAMIESQAPDYYSVIVSDWLMPKLDGIGLLKKLKSDKQLRHIPVILQTALADSDKVQQGLNEGAFYYLTKPLDMDLVQSVIASAVKDAKNHRALRAELSKITQSFSALQKGEFHYKTIEQAQGLSLLVASLTAEPEDSVVGLFELMVNAVEHGNLGITYQEKTELIEQGRLPDEVAQRLEDPAYKDKWVTLNVNIDDEQVNVVITDMGEGFDFEEYLTFSMERALDNHGRGIMMANSAGFNELEYSMGGRCVKCVAAKSSLLA